MKRAWLVMLLLMMTPKAFAMSELCLADNILSSQAMAKHRCYKRWKDLHQLPYHLELKQKKAMRFKRSGLRKPYQLSGPTVEGDTLVFGLEAGQVHAVQLSSFKKLWHVDGFGPIQAKITLAPEQLYFGDSKGFAYALNRGDGSELWKTKLDDAIMAEPLLLGERVFFLTLSGRLYALERKTGTELWHSASFEKNWGFSVHKVSAPQSWRDLVLVGTATGAVQAYRAESGALVWSRQLGDRQADTFDVDAKIWVGDDRLYATSVDGKLARLVPTTGDVLWVSEIGGANDLLLFQNQLFVSADNVLAALDPDTGLKLWEQELDAPALSAPVAGEHFVALASTNDALYFFLPETGDQLHKRFIKKGSLSDPVLVGDRLYVLTNSSRLMSFRVHVKAVKEKRRSHK